jgi:lipid A 3-O-deacylase
VIIILKRINAVKTTRLALLGSILTLSLTPFAARADDVSRLSLSVGAYDSFGGDNAATDFRIEYRPGESIVWQLKPWIGGEVTSDGGVYGAGGFLYDYSLGNNWLLTPALGLGLYGDGNGKDLGSAIEFKEQIEIGYQFQNASRLTGSVSHLSNWGIGDRNPGTDVFGVYYHVPMEWIRTGPGSN